jgi:hypothetical protein
MIAVSRKPIATIVYQHVEEAAILRHTRSLLIRAPNIQLHHIPRLDERIAAHVDGLAVAGDYDSSLCDTVLGVLGVGDAFAATVRSIS